MRNFPSRRAPNVSAHCLVRCTDAHLWLPDSFRTITHLNTIFSVSAVPHYSVQKVDMVWKLHKLDFVEGSICFEALFDMKGRIVVIYFPLNLAVGAHTWSIRQGLMTIEMKGRKTRKLSVMLCLFVGFPGLLCNKELLKPEMTLMFDDSRGYKKWSRNVKVDEQK